jgi:hypothetical protein
MGYSWKGTRQSLKMFRDQYLFDKQKQEIEQLMTLDKSGYIDLYFGDESDFGLSANIPYAWQNKDSPILTPSKKSQKQSIFGLMNQKSQLFSKKVTGGFNFLAVITCIDEFVQTIQKKTILILDNAPIQRSKAFKNKIKEWEKDDLYIYFLPPYSPELNKIEILWRFIKYRWLPFDAFINFKNLKECLNFVLENIGAKCSINFY